MTSLEPDPRILYADQHEIDDMAPWLFTQQPERNNVEHPCDTTEPCSE